jgi:hypothetical protein
MKNQIENTGNDEKMNNYIYRVYGTSRESYDTILNFTDERIYLMINNCPEEDASYTQLFREKDFLPSIQNREIKRALRKNIKHLQSGEHYFEVKGHNREFALYMTLLQAQSIYEYVMLTQTLSIK